MYPNAVYGSRPAPDHAVPYAQYGTAPQPAAPQVREWHPVAESTAQQVGDTNIKCTNCGRVQFGGNTTCNRCGARSIGIVR